MDAMTRPTKEHIDALVDELPRLMPNPPRPAVEAALEAERDYLILCLGEANASKEAAHEEVARIRAEVEVLAEDAYREGHFDGWGVTDGDPVERDWELSNTRYALLAARAEGGPMTDPRTLAQREGPEAMEAIAFWLVQHSGFVDTDGQMQRAFLAAARRLAEPAPVTAAARQAVLDAHEADKGVEHKVMRVNGHESSVDPTGRPYIKSMLVITSDLSVDQGREFRITDGDLVRVSKVEPDKSVEGT